MAILQSRMIALINSALDYQQAFNSLCESIKREAANIAAGTTTPSDAFLHIEAIASARILLQRPSETPPALAVEHYHFSRNARRNQRHAIKMQQLRRSLGTPERGQQTSPFATDELYQHGPTRQSNQSHRGSFPTLAHTASKHNRDLCPGDEQPCYVTIDPDEAHWRCGTVQCPHQKTLKQDWQIEAEAAADLELKNYDTTLPLSQQDSLDQQQDESLDLTNLANDETKPL